MTINIIVIAFDIARIHRGRIRGSIAQILIQFILMQQGAVEGVLIDIGLSGAKVFRLLTTNRHKLSRQDAYGVGGNSVGKPVAKTFPAVSLDVGNAVFGPAQLYFVSGLIMRSSNNRRLGLIEGSCRVGRLRAGCNAKDGCSEQKNSRQFIAIKVCHHDP